MLLGGNYDTEFRLGKYLPLHMMKHLMVSTSQPLGCKPKKGETDADIVMRGRVATVYEEMKAFEVPI